MKYSRWRREQESFSEQERFMRTEITFTFSLIMRKNGGYGTSGLSGKLFPVVRLAGRRKSRCLTHLLICFSNVWIDFGIINVVPIDLCLVFQVVTITRLFFGSHSFSWSIPTIKGVYYFAERNGMERPIPLKYLFIRNGSKTSQNSFPP